MLVSGRGGLQPCKVWHLGSCSCETVICIEQHHNPSESLSCGGPKENLVTNPPELQSQMLIPRNPCIREIEHEKAWDRPAGKAKKEDHAI